jgi:hypothetical protein
VRILFQNLPSPSAETSEDFDAAIEVLATLEHESVSSQVNTKLFFEEFKEHVPSLV